MAARRIGCKKGSVVSQVRQHKRAGGVRASGSDKPLTPRERQRLVQLVICAGAFVALVAVKLLLPEQMARFNETLSAALQRNMDVQSVFSAVGRAFSGEADLDGAAQEVYRAVFLPESGTVQEAAAPAGEIYETALDTLRAYGTETAEEAGLPQQEPQAEVSTLAYVLYSDQNLPEHVTMEQAILGFDYCVPVVGTLSSDFGYREHPVEGEERFHYGVDLAADTGTEIVSFAAGTVGAVGESSSYGKYCIVDHGSGISTLYAHCSKITVSSGATVAKGEKIAEVGETGMATGPHVHFEIQKDGEYLNPIYYVAGL